ncbi:hypothetical protein V7S43_007861 [Phytophthora oleae]|uniref:Uncharacterized protein n=1 Tax=Phytophthora oleae TaxID=2107226 RepID=A0ABD3FKI4_9STRA
MRSARVSIAQAASKLVHDSPALTFCSRLKHKWNEMQVGRQGSYSIERLESLDHYCRTTSRVRVILVCVLTPLPAFTVAVLLECLPLQHPSEGWAANWVFWIRWTLTLLAISFIGVSQLLTYVPGLDFTLFIRWIVFLGSTSVFVGTCILAAVVKGFPVPFMLQLGSIVMGLYIAAMVRLVFSRKEFWRDSPYRLIFRGSTGFSSRL